MFPLSNEKQCQIQSVIYIFTVTFFFVAATFSGQYLLIETALLFELQYA